MTESRLFDSSFRALPATKLLENASARDEVLARQSGKHVSGFASAIRDGQLIVDAPEVVLAAGRQAMVPVIVGANDRDLYAASATGKEQLFANFGPDAAEAHKLYDARGDQTLDELKQQAFADKTLVEPARTRRPAGMALSVRVCFPSPARAKHARALLPSVSYRGLLKVDTSGSQVMAGITRNQIRCGETGVEVKHLS